MRRPTVEQIIAHYGMTPLVGEGGVRYESYFSNETLPAHVIPGRGGDRPIGSAIVYLLTKGTFSRMHRLKSDEIYHFYFGAALEMLQLFPDGAGKIVRMGHDILRGEEPQVMVPRGVWQGSRLIGRGDYALLGNTMAPSFDPADYENGEYEPLAAAYPQYRELLSILCRPPKYAD